MFNGIGIKNYKMLSDMISLYFTKKALNKKKVLTSMNELCDNYSCAHNKCYIFLHNSCMINIIIVKCF